ncbi:MAG: protoporphyrinogen oxidase, partial [Planctomycetia bacterium]|nr:protoporphyrinogen oxidase [Planctomycetia bacterium]
VSGESEVFDAVICTLPTHVYAKVFADELSKLGELGSRIDHSSAVVITAGFKTEQIGKPMNGMGFVVPEKEKLALIAGSFSSHKYPHRAPEGTTLLRLFAGGTRKPDLVNMPENELIELIMKELGLLLKIQGDPIMVDVARWPSSMPQYNLGHLQLLEQFDQEIMRWPGLYLAGNSFRGVGIPACIKSSIEAVEKVQGHLGCGQ